MAAVGGDAIAERVELVARVVPQAGGQVHLNRYVRCGRYATRRQETEIAQRCFQVRVAVVLAASFPPSSGVGIGASD